MTTVTMKLKNLYTMKRFTKTEMFATLSLSLQLFVEL